MIRAKKHELSIEHLEKRELMAADMSFNQSTGELRIVGSDAGDSVNMLILSNNTMDVWLNNRRMQVNPSAVRSITMDLRAGNDRVEVNGIIQQALNPSLIDIKMGTGNREVVNLTLPSVGNLNIDAKSSRGTSVHNNTSITDRLFVDMGNDTAADTLRLLASDVNRLEVNMGGGNDVLELMETSVQNAKVSMGNGNDKVITQGADAYVASGFIDGGSGSDTIDPVLKQRGRRFERVWSW